MLFTNNASKKVDTFTFSNPQTGYKRSIEAKATSITIGSNSSRDSDFIFQTVGLKMNKANAAIFDSEISIDPRDRSLPIDAKRGQADEVDLPFSVIEQNSHRRSFVLGEVLTLHDTNERMISFWIGRTPWALKDHEAIQRRLDQAIHTMNLSI